MTEYLTIVADPPWPYPEGWPAWASRSTERSSLPYPSMTVEAISALPVARHIAREGHVFLWTTNRYLDAAFDVLRAWDCTPKQTLVWCKPPQGKGPGGMFATTTEFVVIGQRIRPNTNAHGKRTMGERVDTSWFAWPRGRHSEKPAAFMDMVERVAPGPYLELFARRRRLGWDAWGDEVESDLEMTP